MATPRAQFSFWEVDGLKIKVRHRVESNEEDPEIDPSFFDDDFNLAVATGGLKVWDGARCLFDFMVENSDTYLKPGMKMLELGSGSGMLALGLAVKGAHILATDVKCGVSDIIHPSLLLNSKEPMEDFFCEPSFKPRAIKIGAGAVGCDGLDWRKPLPPFLSSLPAEKQPELIVASEVVWLRELADPFLTCMRSCLLAFPSSVGIMSFPVRGLDEEEMDTTCQKRLSEVYCGKGYFLKEAAARGLVMQQVAQVPPNAQQQKEGVFETVVFRVSLASPAALVEKEEVNAVEVVASA